ncbi:MAG: two-component regulator propeller domain-containing protein [Thermoanaerobaculia bacterium]
MTGRVCRFFLLLVLALSVRVASAEQLPLKIYTTAGGLASDRIRCILSDSHGFLWFGTEDGISRFDGYGFANDTLSDGLRGAGIRSIIESRDGTYWVATNRGIVHSDPARQKTRLPLAFVHLSVGRSADDVRALLEDRSGTLWAGTHDGLYLFEKGSDGLRSRRMLIESPERPNAANVNALLEDREGNLWVGTGEGLYRRSSDGAVDRIGGRDGSPHDIRCLLEGRDGSFWAGTQREGIVEIHRSRGTRETRVRRAFSRENGLAGNYVASLFQTSDGKIWAGSFGGLSEIGPDQSSLRSYTAAEGLSGTGIWSLAEDRNGNLWAGSDDAGVMKLTRNGFRKYDGRDGLASRRVASLFESRDGQLCAFTRGTRPEEISVDVSFLECFDGRRFHSVRVPLAAGSSFGWGWSQVMLQDGHGEWWVPSVGGLYRFPAVLFDRLRSTAPRKVYTERDGLPSNVIFRIFQDRRENLWLGFAQTNPGVALWDRATESFRSFSAKDGLPAEEPLAFAEDRTGSVWIGFESGLARFGGGRTSFFREANGLPAGGVRALHLDRDGRLWIGTGAGGVARVDRPEEERPQFVRYGVDQGLSSGNISSLTEDRWGRIYIGTTRGLDRLDPRNNLVQHFTEDDGLMPGVIETSFCDRRGNLWFGSGEGLSRLEPAAEAPKPPAPIRITRVLADGVREPLPDLGAREVRLPDLGPGSAPIQIDFLAIDFEPGGRLRYQYLLEGTDRDWSAAMDQRSVVYGQLPPGRHRFRVRAIANDGTVGTNAAEVRFTVLPPFWRRPGVLLLLALGVGALAYALHRSRLRSALAVERVRMRVATDLHDDIGADLSEIVILSELASGKGAHEPATLLREIGERARWLVDSMSDIVWSTDPSKDDLGSVVQRIRHFAANTLESRGIVWILEAPERLEDRFLDPERRRQIFLIVKEALANVARHAGCTRASVRIHAAPEEISLEIEDDGAGFDASASSPKGRGLGNMRARALAMGGIFRVESRPSGGTRILVRVPLGRGRPRRPAS